MGVKTGEQAPSFKLPSQKGEMVSLEQFKGKWVVLYFYPKDDTPGCTKESCTFRDQYDVFKEKGAEVIGVSSDSVSSHQKFADKYRLPFFLLSDEGGKVRNLYGASSLMGLIPGRETFIIDPKGIIRHHFSSQFQAAKHVDEALKIISGN